MKIAVAQTKPIRGNISKNIDAHVRMAQLAAESGAHAVFFPELSLTGYEPELAAMLATDINDPRFGPLQKLSDTHQLLIGAGIPEQTASGVLITMVLFQPHQARRAYSKQYLHADEEPFFVAGNKPGFISMNRQRIALAICYELSVPAHAETAAEQDAGIYIASVAKTARGVENASAQLSDIARRYGMTVLMANAIGESGDGLCAGCSAVWDVNGMLLEQLDNVHEGLLFLDVSTKTVNLTLLSPPPAPGRKAQQ